jgi:hypothetical protein
MLSMDDLFKGRQFDREIIICNDLQTSMGGIAIIGGVAQIDCNWVFGLGSQSLQMDSKSLQTGSQSSASCACSLQMRPGNKTTVSLPR